MLNGNYPPGGKTPTVPIPLNLVDNRYFRVAWAHEIAMHGMDAAIFYGADGGNERLANHLTAEDTLPTNLRAAAAIEVLLKGLEVEYLKQCIYRIGHLVEASIYVAL